MTTAAKHHAVAIALILFVILVMVGVISNRSVLPARVRCYGAYWLPFLSSAALTIATSIVVMISGRLRQITWAVIACALAVFIYSSGYILLCSFLAG